MAHPKRFKPYGPSPLGVRTRPVTPVPGVKQSRTGLTQQFSIVNNELAGLLKNCVVHRRHVG